MQDRTECKRYFPFYSLFITFIVHVMLFQGQKQSLNFIKFHFIKWQQSPSKSIKSEISYTSK